MSPWRGRLERIYITETAGAEMHELSRATLVAGTGIDGDRYAAGRGHYSHLPHPDRQVTLIAGEVLQAIEEETGIRLEPRETRRNLITGGVPLNDLLDTSFAVGETVLFGGRLNRPCHYLEELIGKPVFQPLLNRSGLNCRIVRGGVIRRGDVIRPLEPGEAGETGSLDDRPAAGGRRTE